MHAHYELYYLEFREKVNIPRPPFKQREPIKHSSSYSVTARLVWCQKNAETSDSVKNPPRGIMKLSLWEKSSLARQHLELQNGVLSIFPRFLRLVNSTKCGAEQ